MNKHQIRTTWGQCLVDPLPIEGTTWLEKSVQAVLEDPTNHNAEYFLAMQEVLDEKPPIVWVSDPTYVGKMPIRKDVDIYGKQID